MLIVLIAFMGLLLAVTIGVLATCCWSRAIKSRTTAKSPATPHTVEQEPTSGGVPTSTTAGSRKREQLSGGSMSGSAEGLGPSSYGGSKNFANKSLTRSGTPSAMDKCRLHIKSFKWNGIVKRPTRITDGPLTHTYANYPRSHSAVPRVLLAEIKGDITMYPPDFVLPPLMAARRKAEMTEQYYHLGQNIIDNIDYRRRRNDGLAIPEPTAVEGNHERVKTLVDGTPFLEMRPYLAKTCAKRDDTTRHFLINTQYAARLAVRFRCDSGRYISIPSADIVDACGRMRVMIVATSDYADDLADKQPEMCYYEYCQVPERASDAVAEFAKRPVVGRIVVRLFPNPINLSPNTFYPGPRRRTTVHTATLTNSGKIPCKFAWPDERDVVVSPQTGFIKPQSSVQFSLTLRRPVTNTAIVAEMKYSLNDKSGVLFARFETADAKRLVQVATKALAACDTAEDPGYLAD